MPCQELVELVTAYLDDALRSAERARCDEHLRTCAGCRRHLAQMQIVVGALGKLRRGEGEANSAEKARLIASASVRRSRTIINVSFLNNWYPARKQGGWPWRL